MKIKEIYHILEACINNDEGDWEMYVSTNGEVRSLDMKSTVLLKLANGDDMENLGG